MSSPNQKLLIVHKPKYKDDFLQVGSLEWQKVALLSGDSNSVLITYLYLANNSNNFLKEFSPQDMVNIFGKSLRTWERALKTLMDAGYVIHLDGDPKNKFHFYTSPQKEEEEVIDINCSFDDFIRMSRIEQNKIYKAIVKLDWEKMTKVQEKIHDYYLRYVIEDNV